MQMAYTTRSFIFYLPLFNDDEVYNVIISILFNSILFALYSYYKSDDQIQADWELQGFVDEISADGSVPNGGKVDFFSLRVYNNNILLLLHRI